MNSSNEITYEMMKIIQTDFFITAVENFNKDLNYFNIQSLITRTVKKYKIEQIIKSDNHLFTDCSRSHAQNTSKSMQKMLKKLEVSVIKNLLIKISFKHASKKKTENVINNI